VILEIASPGSTEPLRLVVRRPVTLGGSHADGIAVAGLPPAAIRLVPQCAGLVLSPDAAGLRVCGRPVAPGCRRLLRPGDRACFLDVALSLAAAPSGDRTRDAAAALLRRASRDPTAPPGAHVVVLTGPQAGERAAIADGLVLGRGRGADLRLLDGAASRRHARIRVEATGATAEDLGAKNRLRVNGVPVERKPVPIRPGDLLTVGETELAFEGPIAAAPTPPPPAPRRRAAAGARPLVAAALLALSAAALAAGASCG
jgi:hypothetical protein